MNTKTAVGVIVILLVGAAAAVVTLQKEQSSHSVHYEMVKVPPGEFVLEIPINNSYEISYVKKPVKIKQAFFIGKYEVSNDQWNECFKDGGCPREAFIRDQESGAHPVARVNWHDARLFSQWLSKKTGQNYRLPTEEEWAYAANTGKDSKGEEIEYDYTKITKTTAPPKVTLPLGAGPANAWGLHDLSGNVWEWTLTCWFASEENMLKPRTIEEQNNSEICSTRVVRGAHRAHISDFITDTYNGGCATLKPAANLGFRLVRVEESHQAKTADYKPSQSVFSLTDHNGKAVTEKDYFGKYQMVFFGFTTCTNICPIGVNAMLSTKEKLGDLGKEIVPILISTDPKGDTVEVMSAYVKAHGKGLVGLTGSKEKLREAAKNYRAYFGDPMKKSEHESYQIDHSPIIYFMDKDGKYLAHFQSFDGAASISAKIKKLIP